MSRGNLILLALAVFTLAAATVQTARWRAVSADRHAAARTLQAAASEAGELQRLRTASETRIFGEPPAEDLIDRINRTLASVGLPPTVAGNIVREADRAVPGAPPAQRRRDMRLELRPISPPDLGRFLAAWNADNPAWTARQITLRKSTDRRADPGAYHATLTLSAEYTHTDPGAAP